MSPGFSFNRVAIKRLASRLNAEGLERLGLFRPMYPPLAVELAGAGLTVVHVERERKKPPEVRRYRSVNVPDGALSVNGGRGTVRRPADVASALKEALEKESIEANEISLVLPDHLARVSLLHLGERPSGREETLEMIRWKVKKTVHFNVDDAHIDYQVFPTLGDDVSFSCLTTLVPQKVLGQYEKLFEDLGLHVGLIDLSTFTLVNLYLPVLQDHEGDAAFLNVTGSFFAMMILRQGIPLFYRAKSYAFVDESSRGARHDLVTREVGTSLGYYRERLAGKDELRIFLRCVDLDLDSLGASLQERVGVEAVPMDPRKIISVDTHNATGEEQVGIMQRIAPALGAALGREN